MHTATGRVPERRVCFCGSREWTMRGPICDALAMLDAQHTTIVHGAQRGADRMSALLARQRGFPVDPFPANWSRYGKRAGPIRNQAMLDSGLDFVYAFPLASSIGTWDMVYRAMHAGVPVTIWRGTFERA